MTDSPDVAQALAAEWDDRYTEIAAHMAYADPNPALIAQVAGLAPGRALDIGCGLGAEAIWLAGRGWEVTALDVSQVALDRAAARARHAGVDVTWIQGRLEDVTLRPDGFDLVTAQYPALRHSPGRDVERALLSAVAAGGTLVVVHHADLDVQMAKSYGFDPADYLSHDDLVGLLGDDWQTRIVRRRLRERPTGAEFQHTHDDVVSARRIR